MASSSLLREEERLKTANEENRPNNASWTSLSCNSLLPKLSVEAEPQYFADADKPHMEDLSSAVSVCLSDENIWRQAFELHSVLNNRCFASYGR